MVAWGRGWGKVPWNKKFESPERVFAWLVVFVIILLFAFDFLSSMLAGVLEANAEYTLGFTTGVLGTFYVWFIYSGGWKLQHKNRWVAVVICYAITAVNFYTYHCVGLPFQC